MKLNLQSKFQYLTELILPTQCLVCHLPSKNKLICHHCEKAIIHNRSCCQHCGLTLPISQAFCGDCLKQDHLFTQLHAVADYQEPFPTLIKKFKYAKQLINGELLADLMIVSITNSLDPQQLSNIDYLLPVPLHKKKHQRRGFNQAQLLAEKISQQFNIPILLKDVTRQKQTNAQESLSLLKRKQNLKNAFRFSKKQKTQLAGRYIVIIDDVVTTGATVNSLCQLLLQADAKRIDIWCICRTALPK